MTTTHHAADAGAALLACFEAEGCRRIETPVLQPADLFIDLSGEDIRRRLFLTQDATGRELCLRPEHTIPVCREHVASGAEAGEYCYLGPVFRQREEGFGEFLQVGIESIGRPDTAPADADALGLSLDGFAAAWDAPFQVRIGDMAVLDAVLRALEVSPRMRRRLMRRLAAGKEIAGLAEPNGDPSRYAGLLSAIEGQDPKAARAFVEDVISIAGLSQIGGRSPAEIADRFLAKAENRTGALGDRERGVLERYLAIDGDLDDVADAIRLLAAEEGIDLAEALEHFEQRTGFIAARGIDLSRVAFDAGFVRGIDYYSGFIFEIRLDGQPDGSYLAAGGRYDRLFEHLGPGRAVPAIGCSFWLDRFAETP